MSEFLETPGRSGPLGALMDEYARAAEDLCRVVEAWDPATFSTERSDDDPDCRSPRAVTTHVAWSCLGYANLIRTARDLPVMPDEERHAIEIQSPGDLRPQMRQGLRWTEGALVDWWDANWDVVGVVTIPASWGQTYDVEQMLEHAIVHLLRHRRQLERW